MSARLEFRPGAVLGRSPGAQGSSLQGGLQPPVILDPLTHPGWDESVAAGAPVFFTAGWARVLHDTYGHRPVYFCSFDDQGQVRALLPTMELCSRWRGTRGVSLPFTDLCTPQGRPGHCEKLFLQALEWGRARSWRSLQCRGGDLERCGSGGHPSLEFYGHVIELASGSDCLFQALSPAFRRGFRKAEAAGVRIEFSQAPESMRVFYDLHCQTRRRHGLPPQPWRFFDNIVRHLLRLEKATVATVFSGSQPLAGAVVLHHARQAFYKFGASVEEQQAVRPNNFLMWHLVRWAAERGFDQLHLGRTSLDNQGLRRFKLGLGAREERIKYFKFDFLKESFVRDRDRSQSWVNCIFRRLPRPVLRLAGEILYPQIA